MDQLIPQVEMVPALLDTAKFEPRRCLRKKRSARHYARPLTLYIAAGELWSHGEKEFVDAAVRHKIAEKNRTPFMKQELHREFIAEEFQDRSRYNFVFTGFHCPHFSRGKCRHAVSFEQLSTAC